MSEVKQLIRFLIGIGIWMKIWMGIMMLTVIKMRYWDWDGDRNPVWDGISDRDKDENGVLE